MKPSSAVGGTVSHDGAVSFSGVAAVSLNGVFTTEFDNYLISYDLTKSGATNLGAVLRAAGADQNTGTSYNTTRGFDTGTAAHNVQTLNGARWIMDAGANAERVAGEFRLFRPAASVETMGILQAAGRVPLASIASSLDHGQATAFDGLSLAVTTGAITGTIRVYGYNNG
jgi:hypothetical protein